jgi:hypothetical protein
MPPLRGGKKNKTMTTTKKQSRRLIELGLNADTADTQRTEGTHSTPAWSLQGLLEAMPADIVWNGIAYYQVMHKFLNNETDKINYEFAYENDFGSVPMGFDYTDTNPINAAYEMLVWLLENNLVK